MGIKDWREGQAWKKAYLWAKDRFAGKQFFNQQTGMLIKIPNSGLRKASSHMPDPKPLKAMAKLPELLGGTSYNRADEPKDKAPNVRKFHVFKASATLASVPHDVKIVVREDNNGHWFYNLPLTENKRPV